MLPVAAKFDAFFWFEMHDGLYYVVPDDKVHKFAATGKLVLDNLPYKKAWGYIPSVPLPWDIKIGKAWGSLEEWKTH